MLINNDGLDQWTWFLGQAEGEYYSIQMALDNRNSKPPGSRQIPLGYKCISSELLGYDIVGNSFFEKIWNTNVLVWPEKTWFGWK